MNLVAKVVTPEGKPFEGDVELVEAWGEKIDIVISEWTKDGNLSFGVQKLAPTWGLRIDGKPVLAVVQSTASGDADLGTIELFARPVAFQLFHTPDGLIYGASKPPPPKDPNVDIVTFSKPSVTVGITDMLESATEQIAKGSLASSSLALTSATLKVKGLATAVEDGFAFHLPALQDLIGAQANLSEVSVSFRPPAPEESRGSTPSAIVPDLSGYTQELAQRKLAAAGFIADLASEAVDDSTQDGRVVRQLPAAGASLAKHGKVRVFLGKKKGT